MNIFIKDFYETLRISALWVFMAHQDIVSRYRRTTLGPWWITIGTGIGLTGMGLVWSTLFEAPLKEVFPYFTVGFVCWGFIATSLIESPNIFLGVGSIVKSIKIPFLTFVFLAVLRNLYTLAHNFMLCVIVLIFFPVKTTWVLLLFIPGLILTVTTAFLVSVILGILGGRFRDLSYIINSFMSFVFLITPVMWNINILTGYKKLIAYLNPLSYYLMILREPLLNRIPEMHYYYVVLAIIAILGILANYLYNRFANRLIFWI